MSTTTGQVAVFWDYENCRPPSNVSGYGVMNEIRKVAQQYGRIKTCRGYADLSELSSPRSVTLRSELQCSGLSMIDCPHNGRKNVVDQMMIVDMLTFAIDNESDGSTIVLISGDRDFAYPVSILRFRMYQVVVISPTLPGAHLSLRSQASTYLDWTVMVSSLKDDRSSMDGSPPSKTNIPLPSTNMGVQNNEKFTSHNSINFRPQIRHRPETSPPTTEREVSAASAVMDNTLPVYAAAVNPTTSSRLQTAPLPTTLPPASNSELAPVAKYVYDGLQRQTTSSSDESPHPRPSLVHSPSAPSAISPSSCQNQSDAKGPWTVPPHLRSLMQVLRKHYENGTTQPLRSTIAAELVAQDSKVYVNAGVKTFWELVMLAVKERLVWYSGQGDSACISLHYSVLKRLRFLVDDSPSTATVPIPPIAPASKNVGDPVPIAMDNTPPVYAATTIAAADESTSHTIPPAAQGPEPALAARFTDDQLQKQITGPSDEPLPLPLPATQTHTSSAPSLSQTKSDSTEARIVPIHFRSLVQLLQRYHENGNTQPLRSTIAHELLAQDSKVYENAGVTTSGELIGLAVEERLASYGGRGDTVWVSLHHSVLNTLPPLANESPLNPAILMPPTRPASPRIEAPVVSILTDNTPAAIATTDESTSPITLPSPQTPESTPVVRFAYDESQNQITGLLDEPLPQLTPVPASPSPLPLGVPSSSQSQFDSTAAWAAPLHLRSLVQVLRKFHENGNTQPLRSLVALELVAHDSKVYKTAGVTAFRELVGLAVEEKLVWTGGQGGKAWISLHYDALNRLRSSARGITMVKSPPASPVPSSQTWGTLLSTQSQSGTAGAWTVPPHLRILVLILQRYREAGENQPLRGSVALELVKQDSRVYEKAGVTKFKEYADLAYKARLVYLGGTMGDAWISLHHDAVNKLRSYPLM
ncbi:hypothetical protein PM082_012841 [Marasmius tenuissimus]|nr:hypothetical protein PM082_012841 [Marasmius tenuissimus]